MASSTGVCVYEVAGAGRSVEMVKREKDLALFGLRTHKTAASVYFFNRLFRTDYLIAGSDRRQIGAPERLPVGPCSHHRLAADSFSPPGLLTSDG